MEKASLEIGWIALAGIIFLPALASGAESETAGPSYRAPRPAVRAAGVGIPWVNFRDSIELPARFEGPPDVRWQVEQEGEARALAIADLDEDGMPDLIVGYDLGSSGAVAVYRGNVDALYPYSPRARRRRANGTFVDQPFLTPARLFAAPVPVQLVGAGDFDADGHQDLVLASVGGARMFELRGDGHGGLERGIELELEGGITALEVGEIHRRDGLDDLAVAVDGELGPLVLVFHGREGALRGPARESIPLRSPATDLLMTRVNSDGPLDLAAAAGHELVTFFGHDQYDSAQAPRRPLERLAFDLELVALERGDFAPEVPGQEIALLGADGELRVLERLHSTEEAVPPANRDVSAATPQRLFGSDAQARVSAAALEPEWRIGRRVRMIGGRAQIHGAATSGGGRSDSRPHRLLTARISSQPGDALLGFGDPLAGVALVSRWNEPVAGALTLRSSSPVIDGLALRLTPLALDSLVVLTDGARAPLVIQSAAVSTITVDDTGDAPDNAPGSGTCATAVNTCTLRAAIQEANATSGADEIVFDLPAPPFGDPVIAPTSELPALTETAAILGSSQPIGTVTLLGGNAGPSAWGLSTDADSTTFEGLVIANFASHGILVTSKNSLVEGNVLGKPSPGSFFAGNGGDGVRVLEEGSTIGGNTAAARNLISGNGGSGVKLLFENDGHLHVSSVRGNYIGTDSAGAAASGNGGDGVAVLCVEGATSADAAVGGSGALSNVIAANQGAGVRVSCFDTDVSNNRIGTDLSGTAALGNGTGVEVTRAGFIGGAISASSNVISGNDGPGVRVTGSTPKIWKNRIGLDPADAALGNLGPGILIDGPFSVSAIGNEIAHNGGPGIVAPTGASGPMDDNSVHHNSGIGIDRQGDSVTFNDAAETDGVQNYPVITSVPPSASSTIVDWSLRSTPNTEFRIRFFRSAQCDPTGFGEGEHFVGGEFNQVSDASGHVSGTLTAVGKLLALDEFITATATTVGSEQTSEFSVCRGRDDATCPHPVDVTIDSHVESGAHTIEACDTIAAYAEVRGGSTSVELRAPTVALGNGFAVESGASFAAGPR